jgi:hypothetical protein
MHQGQKAFLLTVRPSEIDTNCISRDKLSLDKSGQELDGVFLYRLPTCTRYTPCPFGQGNDYISARMIFECIINSLYLLYSLNYYPVSL